MKKLILTLTINLLILSTNLAQIPPEAFPLTNSLSGLWRNGEIDKAIESSLELYRLYPPMFIDRIHDTLAQQLEDDSNHYGLTYLELLLKKENQEINEIIAPIYLWSKAIVAKEEQELTSIKQELKNLQKDSSNYESKLERYSLLILNELDSKNATDNEYQVEIIIKNISSLKTYPNIIQIVTDRKESEKRAWHRYLIAYSYDYLYSNVSNKEEYLKGVRDLIDGCTFSYTRQIQMKGLGHAILTGRTLIGDEAFAVVLADDLCINTEGDGVLQQMIKLYNQFRCSIVAIQEVPMEDTAKYGVIAGEMIRDDIYRVHSMVEKPQPEDAPSNLAIIGRYILTPDIFDIIAQTEPGKGGEIQITDALMKQAQDGCVIAYKFKGQRFDCGSVEGYIDATNFCYENLYKKS